MKRKSIVTLLVGIILSVFSPIYGQVEKFDVMTFSSPKGWTIQKAEDSYRFSKTNKKTGHFCVMVLTKSAESHNSAKTDFQYFWNSTIKQEFGVEVPTELDIDESEELTLTQGGAQIEFQKIDSMGVVFTFSGKGRFVGVLTITNHTDYLDEVIQFLSTVDFNFPDKVSIIKLDSSQTNGDCSEEKRSKLIDRLNQDDAQESDIRSTALNLVIPEYPKAASAVKVQGAVTVALIIDEDGNVISAKPMDGHPLLQMAAREAAQSSKFRPRIIEGCKLKVEGTIVYNFGK